MNTLKLRAKSLTPVSPDLHRHDALKSARSLLRELLRGEKPTVDPVRVYIGVSRALGEAGSNKEIEAQLL